MLRLLGDGLVDVKNLTTSAGQTTYNFPNDVFFLVNVTIDGKQVDLIDYGDSFRQEYRWNQLPSNEFVTGRWAGNHLIINPAQVDGLQMNADVILVPDDMVSNSDTPEIPDIYHERLAYYAAEIADGSNLPESRNPALVGKFMEGLVMPLATVPR